MSQVQEATGSGTENDVPVVPDPQIKYEPTSSTGTSYTVPAEEPSAESS